MKMDEDVEKREDDVREFQRYERSGMSLGMKSDIGVCITMTTLTILSMLLTTIKILLIDMNSAKYAALFGYNVTTTTTSTPAN